MCRELMQPSKQQNLITGLNLLRLLVQNRIAEFHTELELIPQEVGAWSPASFMLYSAILLKVMLGPLTLYPAGY